MSATKRGCSAGEAMREQIRQAIGTLTMRRGVPPTNRELCEALGGKSTGHLGHHLRIMREKGEIEHDPRKARSIRLVGTHSGLDDYEALAAERDALRAENASLRAQFAARQSERAATG